jgi:1-acyl-sn-glycerol-3-phosphate acyltransferase
MKNSSATRRAAWARSAPARGLREFVQVVGVKNVMRNELTVEAYGLDQLRELVGPAVFVANHASHLDTAVLLSTLPRERRRRVAVGIVGDYFFDSWLRSAASAIAFNTFPIERDGAPTGTAARLLDKGWSVVVFPEGTRSRDGFLRPFQLNAAQLAVQGQVPVVPVGILGTYAAMPRGSYWPLPGRPRVSIRYEKPIFPESGDTPEQLGSKIVAAVRQLLAEDATSWWQTQRGTAELAEPPAASWRRIWEQSDPPVKGGKLPETHIWRR